MDKRIRRIGIFLVLCFAALFVQLNNIQVVRASSLANNPNNPQILEAQRNQPRGDIISADGVTLASSVPTTSGFYKYRRVYNPYTASLFAQIVGFDSNYYGNNYGVEAEYNRFLTSHTRAPKTLRDLLVNRTGADNVTLTVSAKLQAQVAAAINQLAPGVVGAAAVVLNPATGAIEAMYANPTFDPNPLVSTNIATERSAYASLIKVPGSPLLGGAYGQVYPPGSSFKVVTVSAVLQDRPDLAAATYPTIPFIPLPDTGNPPQVLTNYASLPCPIGAGTLENLFIQSCDANFANIGRKLGAQTLVNEAQLYGFNGKVPVDLPSYTVATSNFGSVASFGVTAPNAVGVPGLMKSAIGQENVNASALQMAMAAGTVANGGVEMTPHVMSQIRDSQGRLVEAYQPKAWRVPISPQTASTITTFMQGVTANPLGTAAGIFPPSWHVAAKTGTAQVGSFGPHPKYTTDWLVAFAQVGSAKAAIAVVLPNEPGSATGAGYSAPIVKMILGDMLANQS